MAPLLVILDIYYTRERTVQTLTLLVAFLPFILILTWESFTALRWEDRHYSRITVGCIMAVICALTV